MRAAVEVCDVRIRGGMRKMPVNRAAPKNRGAAVGELFVADGWGYYSTPAAGACPPGASVSRAVGGCTWARREAQHYILGEDLLYLGFNASTVFIGREAVEQIEQNHAVIKSAFERHEARCCGC